MLATPPWEPYLEGGRAGLGQEGGGPGLGQEGGGPGLYCQHRGGPTEVHLGYRHGKGWSQEPEVLRLPPAAYAVWLTGGTTAIGSVAVGAV